MRGEQVQVEGRPNTPAVASRDCRSRACHTPSAPPAVSQTWVVGVGDRRLLVKSGSKKSVSSSWCANIYIAPLDVGAATTVTLAAPGALVALPLLSAQLRESGPGAPAADELPWRPADVHPAAPP